MYKSILKIIPKIEASDLRKMERSLSQRFKRVAKTFGKGLTGILKGGVVGGLALGLINKVLNPLKEIQDIIEKTLASNDNIVTYAQQFNTTAGRLQKLIALAESSGLDETSIFNLLGRYQAAVAGVANNPNDPLYESLKDFTGKTDTAEGFFEFLQRLQKLDRNQQVYIQELIFGQRQILKMADFFQTDFADRYNKLGLNKLDTTRLTKDSERASSISDYYDARKAAVNIQDRANKARLVSTSQVDEMIRKRMNENQKQNIQITNFKNLASITNAMDNITILLQDLLVTAGKMLNKFAPELEIMSSNFKKFFNSPFWRRIDKYWTGD